MNALEMTQLVVDSNPNTTSHHRSIAIFDATVEDGESLAAGVLPGTEVVVLHPHQDGVAQITELLASRSNIEALHILSHGEPGCLYLGSTRLSTDTLDTYSTLVQQWRNALTPDADILIYGCHVAASSPEDAINQGSTGATSSSVKISEICGSPFLHRLHELTGANIAASANRTGSAAKGGDWELEVRTGEINTPLAFAPETIAEYAGVLTRAPEWIEQFGASDTDSSKGITVDSAGNLYITGRTWDNLGGTHAGNADAWVAKYDSSGTQ